MILGYDKDTEKGVLLGIIYIYMSQKRQFGNKEIK
jgi:hypothetical protein